MPDIISAIMPDFKNQSMPDFKNQSKNQNQSCQTSRIRINHARLQESMPDFKNLKKLFSP